MSLDCVTETLMKITSVLVTRDLQNFTLSCRQRIITPWAFLSTSHARGLIITMINRGSWQNERVKSGDLHRMSIFIENPYDRSFVSIKCKTIFFLKVNFSKISITIRTFHTKSRMKVIFEVTRTNNESR